MTSLCLMLVLSSAAPPPPPAPAPLFPALFSVGLAARGTLLANLPRTILDVDPTSGHWRVSDLFRPQALSLYPSGFVIVDGEVEFTAWLNARALLSSNEVRSGSSLDPPLSDAVTANGQPLIDALANTSMIKELAVIFQGARFSASLGKQRVSVAQGLVYDDFAVGAVLQAQPLLLSNGDSPAVHASLAALLLARSPQDPTPESPFISLNLAYQPSFFEHVGVFGAYYRDTAGGLDDVVSSTLAEGITVASSPAMQQVLLSRLFLRQRTGLGNLGYGGATFSLAPVAGLRLRGAAVYSGGLLKLAQTAGPTRTLSLSGWAAQVRAAWEIVPRLTLSALAFGVSGDQPPLPNATRSNYRAFIGVAPFLTWTGLFFTGGLNQGVFSGRASAAGINGHGVAGGGLVGEWGSLDGHVELRAMLLSALAAAPAAPVAGGGSLYGVEIDVVGEWPATAWLKLSAEVDALFPGSFFPQGQTAWRALVQAYVSWSN